MLHHAPLFLIHLFLYTQSFAVRADTRRKRRQDKSRKHNMQHEKRQHENCGYMQFEIVTQMHQPWLKRTMALCDGGVFDSSGM